MRIVIKNTGFILEKAFLCTASINKHPCTASIKWYFPISFGYQSKITIFHMIFLIYFQVFQCYFEFNQVYLTAVAPLPWSKQMFYCTVCCILVSTQKSLIGTGAEENFDIFNSNSFHLLWQNYILKTCFPCLQNMWRYMNHKENNSVP